MRKHQKTEHQSAKNIHLNKAVFVNNRKGDINDYYEFDSNPLGSGGSGVVYKAQCLENHYHRAVKKISKKHIKNP